MSVIIPCLNEAPVVGRLLLQLQTVRDQGHQLILVDGGSQDGTPGTAAPFVDCLLHSPPGRAQQMNVGASQASGEVLWFLHADTQLATDSLAQLQQAVTQGARWGRFDLRLSSQRLPFRVIETLINLRSRLTRIATGDQGIFIRRELFRELGGYAEIPLMEDVEICKRLRVLAPPASLRSTLLTSSRRWERRGVVRTVLLMWWLRLAYAMGADPRTLARQYR